MKALWILKSVLLATCLWAAGPAFGYELTHDYYNRFRSPYKYNLYLSQQVSAAQSDVALDNSPSSQRLAGNGLQLSAGMEHFRFIQTGGFFSTTQLQGTENSRNELRLVDSGVDLKMVMSTPVSNVIVGGAAVYSRANLDVDGERLALNGAGYRGLFELSYFASTQVSLFLSASHTVTSYSGKNGKGDAIKPVARTSRVGAGLTVWL
ncbi:MAG: hypothetical protein ACO3A4_08745 [Silvanigrellaceae bacterium]